MSDQPRHLLRVRYTVEYTVAVEGSYPAAHRMAERAPTPTNSVSSSAFISFLTDDAKRCGAVAAEMIDIDVCGGYIDIEDDNDDFIDRIDIS